MDGFLRTTVSDRGFGVRRRHTSAQVERIRAAEACPGVGFPIGTAGYRRRWGHRETPGVGEFIVGRIPGIGLHLGLSRGLYAACARLHQVQADVPVEERLFPAEQIFSRRGEDEEREEISREARRSFYEREYERLGRTRQEMAEAYAREDVPPEFLRQMRLAPQPPQTGGGLLEARTDETYVAVERTDPVLAARR